jgi:hypothetical protein
MVLIFRQHILALWPVGDNRCKSTKVTLQTHLVRRLSAISVTCLHISILLKRIFCGTMAARAKRALVAFLRFPTSARALYLRTTASSSAVKSQAASNASKGGYGAMSNDRQSNDNDRVGSSAQQASAATRNAAIQSQAATNQAASQAATQAAASRNPAREIALAQPNAQAQSAMDRFGSRANNPQTVSETLMAQQSLRSLAPPPPIQSMTQTAELGPAIPGAVTTDAGPQPYSMGSLAAPTPPLSS